MVRPVYERHEALVAEYHRAMAEYRARAEAEPKPERPRLRQAYTANLTVEALIDLLADNPRGLGCFNDELSAWVKGMNAYRPGPDRQFWLSCWSCEPYQYNRKGSAGAGRECVNLPRPSVTVYGHLPPDVVAQLAEPGGGEDGLIDRVLFTSRRTPRRRLGVTRWWPTAWRSPTRHS
jgi:hypothetical protein